jgi:hypothetical protein
VDSTVGLQVHRGKDFLEARDRQLARLLDDSSEEAAVLGPVLVPEQAAKVRIGQPPTREPVRRLLLRPPREALALLAGS